MIVTYYFKPANAYPERIYVLYGRWARRNMRAMGIMKRSPFFHRPATPAELQELQGASRMTYVQYEDVGTLLEDERRLMPTQLAAFAERLEAELHQSRSESLILQLQTIPNPNL